MSERNRRIVSRPKESWWKPIVLGMVGSLLPSIASFWAVQNQREMTERQLATQTRAMEQQRLAADAASKMQAELSLRLQSAQIEAQRDQLKIEIAATISRDSKQQQLADLSAKATLYYELVELLDNYINARADAGRALCWMKLYTEFEPSDSKAFAEHQKVFQQKLELRGQLVQRLRAKLFAVPILFGEQIRPLVRAFERALLDNQAPDMGFVDRTLAEAKKKKLSTAKAMDAMATTMKSAFEIPDLQASAGLLSSEMGGQLASDRMRLFGTQHSGGFDSYVKWSVSWAIRACRAALQSVW